MKKLLAIILAVTFVICGCGKNEGSQETKEESNTNKTSESKEDIDGFFYPDYEKYNSYASENGLDGDLIYVEGKVISQILLGEGENKQLAINIEQEDKNRWFVSVPIKNTIDEIENETIRVFGTYLGFSDVTNSPALMPVAIDEEKMKLGRIELLKDGEYSTIWGFEDIYNDNLMVSDSYDESTENKKEKILIDLQNALGEKVGNEAYDILVNQIGFTNLEYVENTEGTGSYIMSSSECDFILNAFPDDKVYRVFQPNGGIVFYEDDTLKATVKELESKTINYDDMSAYYIMAKEIVESGLKNPRSADFPSIVARPEEISMSKNGNVIAVQSYVDSKNSFGTSVRSKWTVQFKVDDVSTYSYTTLYINIDGETLYGEWVDME